MATPVQARYRVQATPKISANQLAAYMVAGDVAREGIIRAAHWQRKVRVIQYKEVRQAISRFLASPTRDGQILEAAEIALQNVIDGEAKPAAKDHARRSIAAVDAFRTSLNAFGFGGMSFRLPPHVQGPLVIHGVEVNVNLDLLIDAVKKPGEKLSGGLILQPGKGVDGDTEGAESKRNRIGAIAATLVYLAMNARGADGPISRKHCLSIDVQRGEAHPCPTSTAARVQGINAACRQIAAMWNLVTAPPDFVPK